MFCVFFNKEFKKRLGLSLKFELYSIGILLKFIDKTEYLVLQIYLTNITSK